MRPKSFLTIPLTSRTSKAVSPTLASFSMSTYYVLGTGIGPQGQTNKWQRQGLTSGLQVPHTTLTPEPQTPEALVIKFSLLLEPPQPSWFISWRSFSSMGILKSRQLTLQLCYTVLVHSSTEQTLKVTSRENTTQISSEPIKPGCEIIILLPGLNKQD